MANRLLAYRVALDLDGRRRGRGTRHPSPSIANLAEQLLGCLVRQQIKVDPATPRAWCDYDLATRAGISDRQTIELFEECGNGAIIREALDRLAERGWLTIDDAPPRGPYRGFAATEAGVAQVNLAPWYRRLLAFFDPPPDRARSSS